MRTVWCDTGWLPVSIGYVPNEVEWARLMRKLEESDPWPLNNGNMATVSTYEAPRGDCFILVCAKRNNTQIDRVLVHEAVHVWQAACKHMGERKAGEEVEAYGIENIFVELRDAVRKTILKEVKK